METTFKPVFKDIKFDNSSLEFMRNTYYIPKFGRPKRIRDLNQIQVFKLINQCRGNQIPSTINYSLPYFQLCLENELRYRERRDNEIANRILLLFNKNNYIKSVIKNYTINN